MKLVLHRIECCIWPLLLIHLAKAVPVAWNNETEEYDVTSSKPTPFTPVCEYEGETYTEGQVRPSYNKCEICTCQGPNFTCQLRTCEVKPGCKALHSAGQCCPNYVCDCQKNGRTYGNGEKVEEPNPCNVCYCRGGEIKCAGVTCYTRADCQPHYLPGKCCPKYDHCPAVEMKEKGPLNPVTPAEYGYVSSTVSPRTEEEEHPILNQSEEVELVTHPEQEGVTQEVPQVGTLEIIEVYPDRDSQWPSKPGKKKGEEGLNVNKTVEESTNKPKEVEMKGEEGLNVNKTVEESTNKPKEMEKTNDANGDGEEKEQETGEDNNEKRSESETIAVSEKPTENESKEVKNDKTEPEETEKATEPEEVLDLEGSESTEVKNIEIKVKSNKETASPSLVEVKHSFKSAEEIAKEETTEVILTTPGSVGNNLSSSESTSVSSTSEISRQDHVDVDSDLKEVAKETSTTVSQEVAIEAITEAIKERSGIIAEASTAEIYASSEKSDESGQKTAEVASERQESEITETKSTTSKEDNSKETTENLEEEKTTELPKESPIADSQMLGTEKEDHISTTHEANSSTETEFSERIDEDYSEEVVSTTQKIIIVPTIHTNLYADLDSHFGESAIIPIQPEWASWQDAEKNDSEVENSLKDEGDDTEEDTEEKKSSDNEYFITESAITTIDPIEDPTHLQNQLESGTDSEETIIETTTVYDGLRNEKESEETETIPELTTAINVDLDNKESEKMSKENEAESSITIDAVSHLNATTEDYIETNTTTKGNENTKILKNETESAEYFTDSETGEAETSTSANNETTELLISTSPNEEMTELTISTLSLEEGVTEVLTLPTNIEASKESVKDQVSLELRKKSNSEEYATLFPSSTTETLKNLDESEEKENSETHSMDLGIENSTLINENSTEEVTSIYEINDNSSVLLDNDSEKEVTLSDFQGSYPKGETPKRIVEFSTETILNKSENWVEYSYNESSTEQSRTEDVTNKKEEVKIVNATEEEESKAEREKNVEIVTEEPKTEGKESGKNKTASINSELLTKNISKTNPKIIEFFTTQQPTTEKNPTVKKPEHNTATLAEILLKWLQSKKSKIKERAEKGRTINKTTNSTEDTKFFVALTTELERIINDIPEEKAQNETIDLKREEKSLHLVETTNQSLEIYNSDLEDFAGVLAKDGFEVNSPEITDDVPIHLKYPFTDESLAPVLSMISDQLQFLKIGEEQPIYMEQPQEEEFEEENVPSSKPLPAQKNSSEIEFNSESKEVLSKKTKT